MIIKNRLSITKASGAKVNSVALKPKENLFQPINSMGEQLFYFQRTIGNQSVQRSIKSGTIQAKCNTVTPYERYGQLSTPILQKQETTEEKEEKKEEGNESKERKKILDDMIRGMDPVPSDKVQEALLRAMQAFSLNQLHKMQEVGVRFWIWNYQELPPELRDIVSVPPLSSKADYVSEIRVVRLGKIGVEHVRHELAHAWDDVRAMPKPRRLDALSNEERIKEIEKSQKRTFWSETATFSLEDATKKIKVSEMYNRYVSRVPHKTFAFDNPGTKEGHSLQSVKEFYAEGYSVFHGTHQYSQAKLLYYAPELFQLLESEAQNEGLPIPNRTKLQGLITEQTLLLKR